MPEVPVYCVVAATSPLAPAIGNQDRDAIEVRHIFVSCQAADRKAALMRQEVMKSIADELSPPDHIVDRLLAYRSTIKVETRRMLPVLREE